MSTSGEKHSPLEQFEIVPILDIKSGNIDLSFTNSSVTMVLTVAIITLFITASVNTLINKYNTKWNQTVGFHPNDPIYRAFRRFS